MSIQNLTLLTNNPLKMASLKEMGFQIQHRVEMAPLDWTDTNGETKDIKELNNYLKTKVLRMGHMLSLPEF